MGFLPGLRGYIFEDPLALWARQRGLFEPRLIRAIAAAVYGSGVTFFAHGLLVG